jgi:hypothetical protein
MARGRTVRLLASLGLATVLGAGCSGTPQASTSLPSASTAKPTPTLPPLGPPDFPVPDKARTEDAAGAEAFIRYYFDLLNRSLRDMNPQYLRQFAQACETCERIARETEQDGSNGYAYHGGELRISSAMSVSVTRPERAESAFLADQEALTIVDRSGRPVPNLAFEAKPGISSGTLCTWDATTSSWRMAVLTLG